MMALLQRVARAHVTIAGETMSSIDHGLLVFLCAEPDDTTAIAARMLDKILKLRVFADIQGRMNLNVNQVKNGLLVVSQFTLAADTRKGNRPGFSQAASPEHGEAMYKHFLHLARDRHHPVASGRFGADMQVHLINDGPVTLPIRITE